MNDHVLTAMRAMLLASISAVEKGQDPRHILRNEGLSQMVRVTGDEPAERR